MGGLIFSWRVTWILTRTMWESLVPTRPVNGRELRYFAAPGSCPGKRTAFTAITKDGTFSDVSKQSGIRLEGDYYGFAVLTGDFQNRGLTDIYVACDSTASLLYRNQGDGTFREVGIMAGCAFNQDGVAQAGMGAAAGDYD